MRHLDFQSSVAFQDIFFHEGKYSPYELVEDPRNFYISSLLGELGSLLNTYCKQVRSPNIYDRELHNDCVDIFIFLLLTALANNRKDLCASFEELWVSEVQNPLLSEKDFFVHVRDLVQKTLDLANDDFFTSKQFNEIFEGVKKINLFITKKNWVENITKTHREILIQEFTDPFRYTPEGYYRGSCYVNFQKLNAWIRDHEVELPSKRKLFLERMESQSVQ